MVKLGRDLEVMEAMARRANRRLSDATVELDRLQCTETHGKIQRPIDELGRSITNSLRQQLCDISSVLCPDRAENGKLRTALRVRFAGKERRP